MRVIVITIVGKFEVEENREKDASPSKERARIIRRGRRDGSWGRPVGLRDGAGRTGNRYDTYIMPEAILALEFPE
jgi:hypothetical protein